MGTAPAVVGSKEPGATTLPYLGSPASSITARLDAAKGSSTPHSQVLDRTDATSLGARTSVSVSCRLPRSSGPRCIDFHPRTSIQHSVANQTCGNTTQHLSNVTCYAACSIKSTKAKVHHLMLSDIHLTLSPWPRTN